MAETIRVGVLGAGNNTRKRHIPGLREQPNVQVVAVCNRSLASSQKVCSDLGIDKACAHPSEIFEDDSIDAVVIGTWPYMHCQYTLDALSAGKHVMCEARMAMNASEGQRMVAASRARPDLVAQIVPSPFTLTIDAAIRQAVDSQLGKLRSVELNLHTPAHTDGPPTRTWRKNRAYSGNNIMAVGIWYEAMMRWVGPVASVHAHLATHQPQGVDDVTGEPCVIDIPDHVDAIGELANGGAFSLRAQTNAGATDQPNCRIVGDNATITVASRQAQLTTHSDGESAELTPDPNAGWRVEAEFIGAIRGNETIKLTDFDTALTYMRFTDALHESQRLGQAIRLV